jgi:protein gp37
MSDKSGIEWTDATWNPVTGCTKVSPGCDHCYAETFAERWRGIPGHPYENGFDVTLRPERLDQPLRWTKPRRIFVNSMSDLFHEAIPDTFIWEVFDVMEEASQHTFQVLTKRHARMRSIVQRRMAVRREYAAKFDDCRTEAMRNSPAARDARKRAEIIPPNIWLGVSVEDQKWADIRVPALLDTPAAVRFLSCEPLLGPVRLTDGLYDWDELDQSYVCREHGMPDCKQVPRCNRIDWVIVGGESGPGARSMDPGWARSLRDQCTSAGVAFHFKQWGGPNKKATGRKLDDRTWDEYPAVNA